MFISKGRTDSNMFNAERKRASGKGRRQRAKNPKQVFPSQEESWKSRNRVRTGLGVSEGTEDGCECR